MIWRIGAAVARRVALVTGASRGIGKATAEMLALQGLNVVVHYHREKKGALEAAKNVEALGRESLVVRADLSSWPQARTMFAAIRRRFDGVDVLVNNAGVYPRQTLETITPEQWRKTLDTNLSSYFYCAKLAVPRMREHAWGRIINLSSILGQKGSRHGAHYASSKAGILGLTKSLALELARHNITVNAIAPGAIETDILKGDAPEVRARRLKEIPMGRVGTPEEIAEVVGFLASDASRYMTGQVLGVNGGLLTA